MDFVEYTEKYYMEIENSLADELSDEELANYRLGTIGYCFPDSMLEDHAIKCWNNHSFILLS